MTPQIRDGIVATATALGIDPIDLATVISYETAGTFDPTKRGPTTKWGQHRGLIQFGEPQAKQFGVNWEDPIGSQLGPDGAIAKYLQSTGVQPGMGLLEIYSAINAGGIGPEYYGRSDAAAGGAPGTVRDKVEKQMADHRRKAAQLLGMETPDTSITTASVPASPQVAPFGSIAPAPSPVPAPIAGYATSEDPKPFGERLSAMMKAWDSQIPEPPRPGPMGDARSTGNALLQFMQSPTAADMFIQKRLAGIA